MKASLFHQHASTLLTVLDKQNITFPQYMVLVDLRKAEGATLTMSKIAEGTGKTTAAATGIIDRLEKQKMVFREHGKADRRTINVTLTLEGDLVLASINQAASLEP